MKENSSNAIRTTLKKYLSELQQIREIPEEEHWEYHRNAPNGWAGKLVPKPSFVNLLRVRNSDKLTAPIEIAIKSDYPEYSYLVGTALSASVLQPIAILHRLAVEAYKRFGTFELADDQIESVMADVAKFFDRTMVSFRLFAPALNLRGPEETPPIIFPDGITLRPITDEECTHFYGGNPIFKMRATPIGFPDFVFVKEIEIPKVFGEPEMKEDPVVKPFQEGLDLCILALSTFKDAGTMGYDGIYITATEFTLGAAFGDQHHFKNDYVPMGHYELTSEEAPEIEAHAKLFEKIHPTLEMASQRLVDSGRRTKQRDTIVDSVIGLESILLANTSDKTELGFRFSLHYASLFPKEERKDAFNIAKGLYNLRSTIAHGSSLKDEVRINGKAMKVGDAATLARSTLRKTINRFMHNSKSPDFMQDGYWLSKELDLV